jgi:hypothetical protein
MKFSDELIRKGAIVSGLVTAVLFILSLVAAIELPGMFIYLAIGMIVFAIIFMVLRSAFNYRDTFKIKERK